MIQSLNILRLWERDFADECVDPTFPSLKWRVVWIRTLDLSRYMRG